RKENPGTKRPFPRWAFWLIAIAMAFNVFALLPQTFSIPAIDFLITSAKLSTQDDIKLYKQSVAFIETTDSRGTELSISACGTILTNHYVVEDEDSVIFAFLVVVLFPALVVDTYPSIDLSVVIVDG